MSKSNSAASAVTIVILAGGRGRRMQERDKGLVELRGRRLIEYVIDAVSPQNQKILINANQHEAEYARYGYPVVADEVSGFQGPLAGMASAMRRVDTPYILTLPCDAPFVQLDYQQMMWDGLQAQQTDLAVAFDGERLQPVHALLPVRLYSELGAFLGGATRRVDAWYARYAMGLVDFSATPQMFCNLNTPEQLEAYSISEKGFGGQTK